MKHRFGSVTNEKGFTFIEILVVMVVGCLVSLAVFLTLSTLITNQNRDMAHMTAVKQVENALYWVTKDTVQSQMVNVNGADYFIDLRWTDLAGIAHEAKYTLDTANKLLKRNYDGAVITIASNVDLAKTTCAFANGRLTIDLTADAIGYPAANESREVNIYPRAL